MAAQLEDPGLTFLGAPHRRELQEGAVAFLGLPFDCGTNPLRIGARLGPSAIRASSRSLDVYDVVQDRNLAEAAGLIDAGDVGLTPSHTEEAFRAIQEAVDWVVSQGAKPLTVGGDGAVTLPQLRALSAIHGPLCVVHFDAHTDAYPRAGYDTATTFTRAAEEGLVRPEASFHIGIRGDVSMPGVIQSAERLGYRVVTMEALLHYGPSPIEEQIRNAVGDSPAYLCLDLDVFDPSCAPGVCDPVWAGLSAREGFEWMERLAEFDWQAIDINTLSPPHDVNGLTASLAATLAWRAMGLLI